MCCNLGDTSGTEVAAAVVDVGAVGVAVDIVLSTLGEKGSHWKKQINSDRKAPFSDATAWQAIRLYNRTVDDDDEDENDED